MNGEWLMVNGYDPVARTWVLTSSRPNLFTIYHSPFTIPPPPGVLISILLKFDRLKSIRAICLLFKRVNANRWIVEGFLRLSLICPLLSRLGMAIALPSTEEKCACPTPFRRQRFKKQEEA